MKLLRLLVLLSAFGGSGLLHAQPVVPVGLPTPGFAFDGQTFTQVARIPTRTGSMEEYLPVGQTLAHWTCMTSVHHLTTAVADPVAATRSVANAVKQRNPNAQILLMNNTGTGDALLDFVTWPVGDAGSPAFFEHDICKYRKAAGGGLIVLQYARRGYGPDGTALLQDLKTERQRLLPLMAAAEFSPK